MNQSSKQSSKQLSRHPLLTTITTLLLVIGIIGGTIIGANQINQPKQLAPDASWDTPIEQQIELVN